MYGSSWDYCCKNDCDFIDLEKIVLKCNVGGGYIYKCFMRLLMIIVIGGRCCYDYECGFYGYKYYWCYIDFNDNWEYCCWLLYWCNKYFGKFYNWCYVY